MTIAMPIFFAEYLKLQSESLILPSEKIGKHHTVKKKLKFIINPISGGKTKREIPELISKLIDPHEFEIDYSVTKSEKDTIHIAEAAKEENMDAIIAVGGDGTINKIAQFLVGSNMALGIVPMGSGNGFARELGIPLIAEKALKVINKFNVKTIDTGLINNQVFINVCGLGFDAHVSQLFEGSTTRGLKTYVRITLRELNSYRACNYQINIDDKEYSEDAFMLVICNGTQFGNNAFIAPKAQFDDGLFNITLIKNINWLNAIRLTKNLFLKSLKDSDYAKTYEGKNITIKKIQAGPVNVDGEPVFFEGNINVSLIPLSLKVIVP